MIDFDPVRHAALVAELDRDEIVLAAALSHELHQVADSVKHARHVSLEELWLRVHDVVAASRAASGTLSTVRVMARGERGIAYDDSVPLPEALRAFRHRGNYHGAYASMADIGNVVRSALGLVRGLPRASRINVTRELHIRGDLWTYVHEKLVHVFGRPGSAADRLLASNRRPAVEPSPRANRPSLTLVASARPGDDALDGLNVPKSDVPIRCPRSISLVPT
ncbi:hypothetical protein [Nannocystis pusilla]|uniref:hypothetical protein n=1 Tax=Nannocystis pusilla TaxID=889268 RepID=UPI003BF3D34D